MHRRCSTVLLLLASFVPCGLGQDRPDPEEEAEHLTELLRNNAAPAERSRLDMGPESDAPADQAAWREVGQVLDRRRVSIHFDRTPFAEALEFVRDVSGLNIVLSKEATERLEDARLEVTLRLRDVRLRSVLDLLLKLEPELRYGVKHGVLWIGLEREWRREMVLEIIPVDELIHRPPDFPGPRMGLDEHGAVLHDR